MTLNTPLPTGVTSGRPSGLHPTACHTASMVAPSDPRLRAKLLHNAAADLHRK